MFFGTSLARYCDPFRLPAKALISAHKMIGHPVKRFRQKTNQVLLRCSRWRRHTGTRPAAAKPE